MSPLLGRGKYVQNKPSSEHNIKSFRKSKHEKAKVKPKQ
jgi:hypothetical protein